MSQNSVKKYAGKSHIFRNIFFLDWAGLGPLILGWAGLVRPSEQWRRCSEEENKEKGRGTDLWWLRGAAGGC